MRKILVVLIVLSTLACKKNKGPEAPAPSPEKTTLVAPAKNEACLQGASLSNTQSTVTFSWNAATHADSYEVVIKNLLTNTSTTHPSSQTSIQVPLLKNTPYSWYVTSKSTKSSGTVQSEIWKFYNSGAGQLSYAPFPAEIVSPTLGQSVGATNGKVNLDWTGSDVDNDIAGYAVYFGTSSSPAILNANVTASELADVAVSSNTTYYWKIVTKDSAGNTSDSGVFQFKVN